MIRDPRFRITFSLVFISVLIREMFTQFYSVHFRSIGLSGFEIGLLMGVGTLTGLLFMFQIGVMTDRMTTRKTAFWCLVLIAFFFFGVSQTGVFWLLLSLFIIGALGQNLFHITMDSFTLKEVNESMGKNLGAYSAIKATPIALGVLTGGFMLNHFEFFTVE